MAAATPICAQSGSVTAALTEASKLLEQGIPVKAIEVINQTLKSGQMPAELAAKAMLMRAQAQEKLGKYAYALADYNSAVWMQGLSSRDKGEAEKGRDRILGKLGVNGSVPQKSSAPATKPEPSQSPSRPPSQRQVVNWDTEVQTSSEERTGGIGSIFGGLFSSSEASQPSQPSQPRQAAAEPRPARSPSQDARPGPKPRVAAAQSRVDPAPPAASTSGEPSGDFAIQMAALISEDGAIYEVDRIAKRYGEWLGGRTPSIKIRETSDGGTLYRVVAEPYQRGEAIATCELLKTKGLNCMLISR